jgi:MFS family permease
LLSRLASEAAYAQVALALGVVGLGTGIFISPNNSALMGAAPRNRQGIAAATLATARSAGMVLGIGISGAIFTTILAQGQGDASLFKAIQSGFLVASLFAALAIFTSAIKNRKK